MDSDPEFSSQVSFFCGSPPARTNNPVIHDIKFAKQAQSFTSPLINSPGGKQAGRVERGSPSCGSSFGGSPKMRIEGFVCGSSDKRCVTPALA